MARENTQVVSVVRGMVLVNNSQNLLNKELPLGEGWYALRFHFSGILILADGAIAGAINTDGHLRYIRNIRIESDLDGVHVDLSGEALHKLAQLEHSTRPTNTTAVAIAATTQATEVDIPVYFLHSRRLRPHDTIFQSGRYSRVTITITTGSGTDCVDLTGGTITSYTVTMNVELVRQRGALPGDAHPIAVRRILQTQGINLANDVELPLRRIPGMFYTSVFLKSSGIAAGRSGSLAIPFSGEGSNAVLNLLTLHTNVQDHHLSRVAAQVQDDMKQHYSLEAFPVGYYPLDLAQDRRLFSALHSGDYSDLRVQVTAPVAGFPAGTNLLHGFTDGFSYLNPTAQQTVTPGQQTTIRRTGR
jgi:hypothetical protein